MKIWNLTKKERAKAQGQKSEDGNLERQILSPCSHVLNCRVNSGRLCLLISGPRPLMFQPLREASSVPVTNILTPEPFFFFFFW